MLNLPSNERTHIHSFKHTCSDVCTHVTDTQKYEYKTGTQRCDTCTLQYNMQTNTSRKRCETYGEPPLLEDVRRGEKYGPHPPGGPLLEHGRHGENSCPQPQGGPLLEDGHYGKNSGLPLSSCWTVNCMLSRQLFCCQGNLVSSGICKKTS